MGVRAAKLGAGQAASRATGEGVERDEERRNALRNGKELGVWGELHRTSFNSSTGIY